MNKPQERANVEQSRSGGRLREADSATNTHLGDHAVLDVLGQVAAVGVLHDQRHVVLRHEHLVQLADVRVARGRALQRRKSRRASANLLEQWCICC